MKKGSKGSAPDSNAIPSEARRKYDPEQTKRNILDVATQEFSAMGLSGARVDAIAERTNTTKRMLYYYFTNKEQLYIAVLEQAYATARDAERQADVDHLDPVSAIRALATAGIDVRSLIGHALVMARSCGPDVPPHENPAVQLGRRHAYHPQVQPLVHLR